MRPGIDLEPWRESIANWIAVEVTQDEILARLQEAGVRIGRTTLTKALKRWQLRAPSRRRDFTDSPELRALIAECYTDYRLADAAILATLESRGFSISDWRLKQLRLQAGLPQRLPAHVHEAYDEHTASLLRAELDEGTIESSGVGNLYVHMRKKYNIVGR